MTKQFELLLWQPNGKLIPLKELVGLIPKHLIYVEVFGGSFLFAKPPSKIEVYNDIDSEVVNFFRVLRDKFDEFQQRVLGSKVSDDVERAWQFFTLNKQYYNKSLQNSSPGLKEIVNSLTSLISSYLGSIDLLTEICVRLLIVQVEHKEFKDLIKTYDSEDTFFYLDPTKAFGMETEKRKELAEILPNIKGKFMLNDRYFEIYETLEKSGAKRLNLSEIAGGGQEGDSFIWLNYDFEGEMLLKI